MTFSEPWFSPLETGDGVIQPLRLTENSTHVKKAIGSLGGKALWHHSLGRTPKALPGLQPAPGLSGSEQWDQSPASRSLRSSDPSPPRLQREGSPRAQKHTPRPPPPGATVRGLPGARRPLGTGEVPTRPPLLPGGARAKGRRSVGPGLASALSANWADPEGAAPGCDPGTAPGRPPPPARETPPPSPPRPPAGARLSGPPRSPAQLSGPHLATRAERSRDAEPPRLVPTEGFPVSRA